MELAINGGTPVINYSLPTIKDVSGRDVGQEEIAAVIEVLKTGNMGFIFGTKIKELQKMWEEKFGGEVAIATSSGTAALHTALIFLNIGAGDEVLVPAYTDMSTILAVLLTNAVPIIVDIDPKTHNIDPTDIEKKITSRSRAIIPVHVYGYPADMDRIMEIAKKNGLSVVEDCAQAHISTYKGKLVGTFGDVACWSFQQSKHMTTGDGGMVMAKKELLFGRKLIQCHDKGWPRDSGGRDHLFLAPNYHMTELQAAVGLEQFKKLDAMTKARRNSALYLSSLLKNVDGIEPPSDDEKGTHTFFAYNINVDLDKFKVGVGVMAKAITAEGVSMSQGLIPKPLYMYPVLSEYKTFGSTECPYTCSLYPEKYEMHEGMCPVTEHACVSTLYMLWSEKHTKKHAEDIAKAIIKVLDYYRK